MQLLRNWRSFISSLILFAIDLHSFSLFGWLIYSLASKIVDIGIKVLIIILLTEVGLIQNKSAWSICEVPPKIYLNVTINRSLAPIVSRLKEDFVIAGQLDLTSVHTM